MGCMRTFQDMSAEEGLSYGLGLLCRCTLPGEDPAFSALFRLFERLLACELPAAVRAYHDAVGALLSNGDRRVSGDLWKDHLLSLAVHQAHPFARMAAAGGRDEAIVANMREELSILGQLSRLRSEDVARFAFTPWQYGESGLVDSYIADEALEEIYVRLLSSRDWGDMTEDLWSFFNSYGAGIFLRHRAFYLEDGQLAPLPSAALSPLVPTTLYEQERVALMENTIRFMRGDRAENALLYGGGGTGKTAHVLSLLHELPEVRLVICQPEKEDILALARRLGAQPLRFLLLLDDIVSESKAIRRLSSLLCGGRALPDNVLLYATSREAPGPASLFSLLLSFPYPNLADFTHLVTELLEADGIQADSQALHSACVDHQVDARERLTFPGAIRVAEAYKA
ncbi:MAG: DUF815 domain-containing protein [Clostridia bacterium]|nr:DUF815 domain-containing protein [Clostridia bacterium]